MGRLVIQCVLTLAIWALCTLPYAQTPLFVPSALPISVGIAEATLPFFTHTDEPTISANIMFASYADSETVGGEQLVLDGESSILQIIYSRPISLLGRSSILQLRGGLLYHGSGKLDSLIDGWHDFFGLPQGDRPVMPRDRLLYQYNNQQNSTEFIKSAGGVTDTSVQILTPIGSPATTPTYYAYAAINLPTGNSRKLTGSEEIDTSIGIVGNWKFGTHWLVLADASYSFIGDKSQFGIPTKRHAWHANIAIDRRLAKKWRLLGGLQMRSAVFESELKALGSSSMQLNLGLRKIFKKNVVDLYFSEDIAVNRSADFAFGIRWHSDF